MSTLNSYMDELRQHANCAVCLVPAYIPCVDKKIFDIIFTHHFHIRLIQIMSTLDRAFDMINKYNQQELAFLFIMNNLVELPLVVFKELGPKFSSMCIQTSKCLSRGNCSNATIARSTVEKLKICQLNTSMECANIA